jgi:hypothetical protein
MTDLFDFKRLAGIWPRERAASFPHTTQSASCHNRRHDRKGVPGWLRKLPIDTALKDTDDQMLPLRPR